MSATYVTYIAYNPTSISDEMAYLPDWLETCTPVSTADIPSYSVNWDLQEKVVRYVASFYGAEYWYHELYSAGLTPESRLVLLSEDDIQHILVHGAFSDNVRMAVEHGLQAGFHFIKSSKKSSNMCRPVYNIEQATAEICDYADVLITFKYGCRYLFMRRYVHIDTEYRVVVHHGQVKYIEPHTLRTNITPIAGVETEMRLFMDRVMSIMHYKDATVDIALLQDGSWTVIEIKHTYLYVCWLTI